MLELDFIKKRVDLESLKALLSKDKNVVFVDLDTIVGELKPKSTLILSPSFYWVRKEQLPVKYSFEVKKLLPSLFDGLLPSGEFSYKATKEGGNSYIVFAYSDKEIVERLQRLGIKDAHIGEIYFAQSELLDITTPLQISEEFALINQDGIICKIPLAFVDSSQDISFFLRDLKLTKNRINVNIFSHSLIDSTSIKRGSVAIMLVILALFTKYFLYQQTLNSLEQQKFSISKSYNLPATQIQLNALKSSLQRDSSREIAIREKISFVLRAPLIGGSEFIHKIAATKQGISFEIELKEPKRAEALRDYLQKELEIDRIRVVDNIMKVETKS